MLMATSGCLCSLPLPNRCCTVTPHWVEELHTRNHFQENPLGEGHLLSDPTLTNFAKLTVMECAAVPKQLWVCAASDGQS